VLGVFSSSCAASERTAAAKTCAKKELIKEGAQAKKGNKEFEKGDQQNQKPDKESWGSDPREGGSMTTPLRRPG